MKRAVWHTTREIGEGAHGFVRKKNNLRHGCSILYSPVGIKGQRVSWAGSGGGQAGSRGGDDDTYDEDAK